MPQQIVAQELLLRGFQLDGQIRMTGWPFRSTGWPFGHPVNMLGEALAAGADTVMETRLIIKKQHRRNNEGRAE